MRTLFLLILILMSAVGFAQDDSETLIFLNDIILKKNDTATIHYTDKIDAGMYDYMLKKSSLKKTVKDIGNATSDKIILSSEELKYLKKQLLIAKNEVWNDGLFSNSLKVSVDSINSFLRQNRNNNLYLFSKPAFIRNKTIALFYVVHLCCGGIYGPVDLSFYKKTGSGWQKWIRIDGGAF